MDNRELPNHLRAKVKVAFTLRASLVWRAEAGQKYRAAIATGMPESRASRADGFEIGARLRERTLPDRAKKRAIYAGLIGVRLPSPSPLLERISTATRIITAKPTRSGQVTDFGGEDSGCAAVVAAAVVHAAVRGRAQL